MQREIDWSRLRQIEEDLQIARPNSRKIWSWWCSWRCTIGQCPRGATKEVCKKSNTYNTFAYRLVALSRDIQIVLRCCLILLPPSLPSSAPPAFPYRISNWTFISASPGLRAHCTRTAPALHTYCTCIARALDAWHLVMQRLGMFWYVGSRPQAYWVACFCGLPHPKWSKLVFDGWDDFCCLCRRWTRVAKAPIGFQYL